MLFFQACGVKINPGEWGRGQDVTSGVPCSDHTSRTTFQANADPARFFTPEKSPTVGPGALDGSHAGKREASTREEASWQLDT